MSIRIIKSSLTEIKTLCLTEQEFIGQVAEMIYRRDQEILELKRENSRLIDDIENAEYARQMGE